MILLHVNGLLSRGYVKSVISQASLAQASQAVTERSLVVGDMLPYQLDCLCWLMPWYVTCFSIQSLHEFWVNSAWPSQCDQTACRCRNMTRKPSNQTLMLLHHGQEILLYTKVRVLMSTIVARQANLYETDKRHSSSVDTTTGCLLCRAVRGSITPHVGHYSLRHCIDA